MNDTARANNEMDTFVKSALIECYYRIFRVNINTGEYEIYKDDGLLGDDTFKGITDIFAFMKKLVDDKIIFPEYATACRRFSNPEYVRKSVFLGEKRIVQSYKAYTAKGIQWVTFTITAGQDCSPENPMVLFMWREADSEGMALLDALPTISSLYDKLIKINLTNNTYEPVLVDADEQERLVGGVINMYEWWAGYSKDGNIAPEDMGAFSALTRTGSLQKRFAESSTPVSFRYRRKVNGEFRWMQLQLAPSVEYSSDNQIVLLSLKDVHEEYTAQLKSRQKLVDNMNHDALTNLYNRLKYNEDIEALEKKGGDAFCCMYIDVNGLHEVNNTLGHTKGDDMLCGIAQTLTKFYPEESVYRIGGDEFVVMSLKLTKRDMERAIAQVRSELLKSNYEISVGLAEGVCRDVEKVIAAAEQAMRNDKAAYYRRHGDARMKREMNEELEQMLVEKHDNERFLELITRQFSGVHYVDLESDVSRDIYYNELFSGLLEKTGGLYSAAMRLYVEGCVKEEYHESFEDILDYDKLDKKLRNNKAVEIVFENLSGQIIILRILEVERRANAKAETIWMIWKRYEVKN